MDWSKIKTIFIITFLILDIYLLNEFIKIRDASQYDIMTQASFEEKLKTDEIEYVSLPQTMIKDKLIIAKSKVFDEKDIEKLKGQQVTILDGTTLEAELEEPYKVSTPFELQQLRNFVKNNLLYGDQYEFWGVSEEESTITFFQEYQEKQFYHNINGKVTFFLNKDKEIIAYEQTLLEDIEEFSEKEEVLKPIQAIETLYEKRMLKPKSKVTEVELGYFTLVQLTSSQVLAPTWHFVVNGNEHLFVNAFEGQIIELNKNENKILE